MKKRVLDYAVETVVAVGVGIFLIGYAAHLGLKGKRCTAQ